MENILPFQLV